MRQRLKLLAYFAIFWIGFQVIVRAIFMLYNHDLSQQLSAAEISKVFWNGLKMDISMSGYFLMLTGLILTFSVLYSSRWLFIALNSVTILVLFLSCVIVMVDLELYRHWGFRLNTTPFFYLAGAESEAVGSVEIGVVVKLLMILAVMFAASLFLYSRWLMPKVRSLAPAQKKSAIVLLIVTALLFIPIRGSFTVAPMNTGFVYFHKTKL